MLYDHLITVILILFIKLQQAMMTTITSPEVKKREHDSYFHTAVLNKASSTENLQKCYPVRAEVDGFDWCEVFMHEDTERDSVDAYFMCSSNRGFSGKKVSGGHSRLIKETDCQLALAGDVVCPLGMTSYDDKL
ncbi:hypothetical protein FOL47_000741, partial [Perkinsus chesapeaki]